jgi:hypothetical protein
MRLEESCDVSNNCIGTRGFNRFMINCWKEFRTT